MKLSAKNRLKGHPDKTLFIRFDHWRDDPCPFRARRVILKRALTLEGLCLKLIVACAYVKLAAPMSDLTPDRIVSGLKRDVRGMARHILADVRYNHEKLN